MTNDPTSIDRLFAALAAIYASEGRDAAIHTAAALMAGTRSWTATSQTPCGFDAAIRATLAQTTLPAAEALLAAQALVPWGVNPVAGRMTGSAAAMIAVCTLLGPEGPIVNDAYRLGLVYMQPNAYYPLHNHDADETYIILAGSALWTAGDDTRLRTSGHMIHHPSLMPHAFRTAEQGFVALWRWSGDINTHSYTFLEQDQSAGAGSAQAEQTFCNGPDHLQDDLIGYEGKGGWTCEGGWNINPGTCADTMPGDLKSRQDHYRAEVDGDFSKIDTGPSNTSVTLTLTPVQGAVEGDRDQRSAAKLGLHPAQFRGRGGA